jgi:glyoxylase-like metal-dependent hydrolase (beta-lactamase superfamily II)
VKIDWVTVGPFQENSYLAWDEESGRGVLVDPGDEAPRILEMVQRAGVTLESIWLTHAHLDHIGAITDVRRAGKVPVLLHPADLALYRRAAQQAAFYGLPFDQPQDPDRLLEAGEELRIGDSRFVVRHVPGHSPGHVIFVGESVMLGGDLLFAGSIGRTDLPLSDPRAMETSLASLATLDPDVAVYPGHGPPTTIGAELATNPFRLDINRQTNPVR